MTDVRHLASQLRFETGDESSPAFLEYEIEDGRLTIAHTFVPPAFRGRGVAESLTRAALEFARTAGLKVDARCAYAEAFLRRHAEFADLRASDPRI